jgi:hypothetical protein
LGQTNSFKPPLFGAAFLFSPQPCRTCSNDASKELEEDMAHQFQSGQLVRLCHSIRSGAAEGDYKIVRQLPDEGGERRYRVKSMQEPHERVVKESDIRSTPPLNFDRESENFVSQISAAQRRLVRSLARS